MFFVKNHQKSSIFSSVCYKYEDPQLHAAHRLALHVCVVELRMVRHFLPVTTPSFDSLDSEARLLCTESGFFF